MIEETMKIKREKLVGRNPHEEIGKPEYIAVWPHS
jgi:hypothetical protein